MNDSHELRSALIGLASYAATALSINTTEWMEGLVEQLNSACEALGDKDRFELDRPGVGARIVKGNGNE